MTTFFFEILYKVDSVGFDAAAKFTTVQEKVESLTRTEENI